MTTKEIEIEVRGGKLVIMPRRNTRGWRDFGKAPRMYVHVSDETIMDNLVNRKRRPYNVYKTLIHASDVSDVLNLGKLSWSQYAGCTCPCSPGFILPDQTLFIDGEYISYFDVWMMFDSAPSVDETKPARVLAGL